MKLLSLLLGLTIFINVLQSQEANPLHTIEGPNKLLGNLKLALETEEASSNLSRTFSIYSEYAIALEKRGNYKEADSLFTHAFALTVHEPDSSKIINLMLAQASMHKEQGRFTVALQAYIASLDFYKKRQDVNGQLWVYGYMAELYRATSNAESCYKLIMEGEELMSSAEVADSPKAYFALRKASYYLQFLDNAIESNLNTTLTAVRQSLELAEKAKDTYLIGLNENGLGHLLLHEVPSASTEAIRYLNSAKNHMLTNERYRNYAAVLHTLALYYARNGQPELAEAPTLEAMELSKKNDWNSTLGDFYRMAGEVYFEMGQFKQSATYMNEALWAKLATADETHSIELGELTASYEKDIAEQKLIEQQKETLAAQQREANSRTALNIIAVFSAVLLIIAIILIVYYLRYRKANALLYQQEEITRKANKQLNNLVEQKNVLYKELNHRVKNNLTVLSSLIHLQEDDEQISEQRVLYQTLRQRIRSMALVHQNLYQFDEALNINFQNYLRQLIPGIASIFCDDRPVNTNISCENLIVDIDEAVPLAMTINELITNSFKHAFNDQVDGKIEIWSVLENGKRHIHYKDNGPGLPNETESADTQKLGVMLIGLMVEQLHGNIKYQGNNNGVYYLIELPEFKEILNEKREKDHVNAPLLETH